MSGMKLTRIAFLYDQPHLTKLSGGRNECIDTTQLCDRFSEKTLT